MNKIYTYYPICICTYSNSIDNKEYERVKAKIKKILKKEKKSHVFHETMLKQIIEEIQENK